MYSNLIWSNTNALTDLTIGDVILSTISAIVTPQTAAGAGIVRLSGEDAINIADKVFKGVSGIKLNEKKGYTALFGHIYDGDDVIDEAVALLFRAPKSYTGEDVVEFSCHGGLYILSRVLRATLNAGAVPAEPGEYTKRAFLEVVKTAMLLAKAIPFSLR